jgi:hypothetical protein
MYQVEIGEVTSGTSVSYFAIKFPLHLVDLQTLKLQPCGASHGPYNRTCESSQLAKGKLKIDEFTRVEIWQSSCTARTAC